MRLHVRAFFAIAPLLVCLPAVAPAAPRTEREERPRSVLFYLVDTCRNDRMGFDGYERETTPFLDWLAERSVVFEACTSQAPWTKPSMASMLCSQYPRTLGLYRMEHRLPDELRTWPEVLQAHGMFTAGFSANIVMGNELSNLAQGFDHFVESTQVNAADAIHHASGSARKLNEHAFAWLDATDHWPMLLYLHSVDPHEEYEPEPRTLERFADPARHPRFREEWQALLADRPPIPGLYVTQESFDRTGIDSASFVGHASDLYDADVRCNDDQLRRLWERLQEDGWGEDLILVLTSDHGEEFFDHGGTSHGYSLYDELLRVPLMIYAPGLLPGGKRIQTPVRSLDLYPTLCELLGIEIPEGLQGRSLVPLILGEEREARPVFSEHREDPVLRRIGHGSGVLVSLRIGRWKLIRNELGSQFFERPRLELYDLEADPRETTNVAELHPDVVRRLGAEIEAFVEEHQPADSARAQVDIDPAIHGQLRALGYVGDEEPPDLWAALASKEIELVRGCLRAGANPDQLDEVVGSSPLSYAAAIGDLALAELLLDGGAKVDVRNKDGSTSLHGAALFGRVEIVELLLAAGADPGAKNTNGDDVLSATACPWNLTEFIAMLAQIELDRDEVEAGRTKCAELLRSALEGLGGR